MSFGQDFEVQCRNPTLAEKYFPNHVFDPKSYDGFGTKTERRREHHVANEMQSCDLNTNWDLNALVCARKKRGCVSHCVLLLSWDLPPTFSVSHA